MRSRKLSGGQLRRLDFALALVGDPELIFLDEPTTGFDPEARRGAWETVRRLRDLGKTILLTTHYLDEAQELADRVAIVKDGRVLAIGPPRELGVGAVALPRRLPRPRRRAASNARPTTRRALLHELTGEALARGERLEELSVGRPTLEDVYLELTADVLTRSRSTWRQYRLERRMFWRNPSAAFFNFLLPLLFLVAGGAILHGNQRKLNQLVPAIAGDERDVDDVHGARLQHRVPARARRAQAHPRHAAADRLLLRRRGRQRGHEHGAADRDRRARRASWSSGSAGRATGSSWSCSCSPASCASPRSAWRSRT